MKGRYTEHQCFTVCCNIYEKHISITKKVPKYFAISYQQDSSKQEQSPVILFYGLCK